MSNFTGPDNTSNPEIAIVELIDQATGTEIFEVLDLSPDAEGDSMIEIIEVTPDTTDLDDDLDDTTAAGMGDPFNAAGTDDSIYGGSALDSTYASDSTGGGLADGSTSFADAGLAGVGADSNATLTADTSTSTDSTTTGDGIDHAQAATDAQAQADQYVAAGDYASAESARETAENESYSAGDDSMLHGSTSSDLTTAHDQQGLLNIGILVPLFGLLVGLLISTGEFRHQTITPTLLATPQRLRVVGAKLLAAAAVGAVAALLIQALIILLEVICLAGRSLPVKIFDDSGVWKSVAFGAVCTLIATFQGYTTAPTSEGVAYATTRTVVFSSIATLALDFVMTAFLM